MVNKVSEDFQIQVDQNHYSEGELLHFKVPLSIPYVSGSLDFAKAQGSIELNGITYQYVKKRIYRDTLEVLCLPNHAQTALRIARDQIYKLSSDFINLHNSKNPVSPLSHKIKLSIQDYTLNHFYSLGIIYSTFSSKYYSFSFLPSHFVLLRGIDQPPEA